MNPGWPSVPLAEVLQERNETPSPEAVAIGEIPIVSKISFDNGRIELRSGGQTKTGMILVRPGDLVVSGINAAKGAVAIHGAAYPGPIAATIHYGAYAPRTDRVDVQFLWWLLRSRAFRELLLEHVPGGIKTELKAKRLLPIPIPLPPLAEQRRIVARIEQCQSRLKCARDLRSGASRQLAAAVDVALNEAFPVNARGAVADYVSVQSGYAFKSEWFSEEGIRLVRNANIGHGSIDWAETVRIPETRRSEFGRFELEEGDILLSLDRPLISTGVKVVKVRGCDVPSLLLQRVGRIRFSNESVDREFFFAWLRSPRFREAIDPGRSNGVPHISPKDVERIPFSPPPVPEQRRIVSYLDDLQAKVDALKTLQEKTTAELDALLPSILDKAFRGEL
jgi:type I restriction enzyme, S subunit